MATRVFLQQLYPDASKGDDASSNFDVILVHGVNGDPVTTWEYKPTGDKRADQDCKSKVWPRDLLPEVFPKARVLSFGYNGDMYRNDSVAGIRDLGRSLLSYLTTKRQGIDPDRPIIFVAHCLGGLIVKQFFFGTPHNGTNKDKWNHIANAYSPMDKSSMWGRRSRLVKSLKRNSQGLADLVDKFRHVAERYRIVSFYEMKKMKGANACIVDKAGARLEIANEKLEGVDADHVGMCRFERAEDMTFQVVCRHIREVVGESAS
ncbi:hypothetical protein QBC34DRAFT_484415 [Podospora aff. communis PSN243]|uniref:DUF676 domain-containing protein n=1 Tax=Podospora aff. communis PSN243 TaxID=3040156 RepID=A0AAV9GT51_9PEZI|nr:hypothetical protein QBC34DRAFT_484415 [Podospora aff. communis PSN243]